MILAKRVGWLQEPYPRGLPDPQRRIFERRVGNGRGQRGPNQTVVFPQMHDPDGWGASDFTSMTSGGVTMRRQPFDHLLYQPTLTHSNREFVSERASHESAASREVTCRRGRH